jgi:predicted DsbA family dithiol-disulfide isomerase
MTQLMRARWIRHSVTLALGFAITTAFVMTASTAALGAPPATSGDRSEILGTIGTLRITSRDVLQLAKDAIDQQDREYERQLRQLQHGFDQARHDLIAQRLDALLDQRALELEAAARGGASSAVLADLKVAAVTEEEIHDYYELNRERSNQSYAQLAPQIKAYLENQHTERATRAFYDELRSRHSIRSMYEPYRMSVAATGPARGSVDARVTIIEFGDFQCPYCKLAETALRKVMAHHPQDVRLIFRQLPLTQLHPDAMTAAEAAVCARRQGMFWELHDAMYQDQNALSADAIKASARTLGLNVEDLSSCMSDGATKQVIDMDQQAADSLGIESTPFFFVNGRPISGSAPVDRFEAVIDDELGRLPRLVSGVRGVTATTSSYERLTPRSPRFIKP